MAVSLLLLALAGPVIGIAALAIRYTSPGSVLFKQKRIGLNGRMFTLYKFRTMIEDAHARLEEVAHLNEMNGPVFKAKADPRVTPVGRFMRRFSLDEAPQLLNVLFGDMSLVGPRPLVLAEHAALSEAWQSRRAYLRPGLTGPWQVSGRSELDFDELVRLDFLYLERWSVFLDLTILLQTVPAVFRSHGAW